MVTKTRQHISQVLTGCCALLWLTGFLTVGQENLTAQWTVPHCPQGQTPNGQQSHNHCAWHCGGLDIQSGGARDELSTNIHVSRVWRLGSISLPSAAPGGKFLPRGPPHSGLENADNLCAQEPAALL